VWYRKQQLGGWKSFAMVQRYAAFAPDHLASAAEAIGKAMKRKRA